MFRDKVVLITGASSGIGQEFAKQFANQGAQVIAVARRESNLKQLISAIGVKHSYIVCDLTNINDLNKLTDFIKANQINILINNAGHGSFGYFDQLNLDNEISQINLNIIATLKLVHAVVPQMKKRKAGDIISISSIAAFQPIPLMATYASTKAFNFFHSLALREEFKSYGINVLTVCPGPTATEFGGVARVPGTISGIARDNSKKVVAQAIKALANKKPYIITTGLRSKFLAYASHYMSKIVTTKLLMKGLKKAL